MKYNICSLIAGYNILCRTYAQQTVLTWTSCVLMTLSPFSFLPPPPSRRPQKPTATSSLTSSSRCLRHPRRSLPPCHRTVVGLLYPHIQRYLGWPSSTPQLDKCHLCQPPLPARAVAPRPAASSRASLRARRSAPPPCSQSHYGKIYVCGDLRFLS
jgi:hypothetical protein